jgi:hypothetical protein
MVRCSFCQGELSGNERFCRRCGRVQPESPVMLPAMPAASSQVVGPVVAQVRRARRCPTCQGLAYMEDRFCMTCSRPLRQPCPHCGKEAPIWGQFCSNCSLSLAAAPAQVPASAPAQPAAIGTAPLAWGYSGPMPAIRPGATSPTPTPAPAQPPASTPGTSLTPPNIQALQAEAFANLPTQISSTPPAEAIKDAQTLLKTPTEPPPGAGAGDDDTTQASAQHAAADPNATIIQGLPGNADPDATLTPVEAEKQRRKSPRKPINKGQAGPGKKQAP